MLRIRLLLFQRKVSCVEIISHCKHLLLSLSLLLSAVMTDGVTVHINCQVWHSSLWWCLRYFLCLFTSGEGNNAAVDLEKGELKNTHDGISENVFHTLINDTSCSHSGGSFRSLIQLQEKIYIEEEHTAITRLIGHDKEGNWCSGWWSIIYCMRKKKRTTANLCQSVKSVM